MNKIDTEHKIYLHTSQKMEELEDQSIELVVTSPPYPLIEMWDDQFFQMNKEIETAVNGKKGFNAFELMHLELDKVWTELFRVVTKGGFVCINIGDATRTIGNDFALYPNHARISSAMIKLGFTPLPEIIWRKQSNAPNKFMGSGMLPAGAYVTQEHEYILIFRKGHKRYFDSADEKTNRRQSSFFWEERNLWFSDIWMDLKGVRQKLAKNKSRQRSGAFPFELAFRLINMYSAQNDTVLDPFWGTGTTSHAAIIGQRNSVGYEISKDITQNFFDESEKIIAESELLINERLQRHIDFIKNRLDSGKIVKHSNNYYGFPVVTKQEAELCFKVPESLSVSKNQIKVSYKENKFDEHDFSDLPSPPVEEKKINKTKNENPYKQKVLF